MYSPKVPTTKHSGPINFIARLLRERIMITLLFSLCLAVPLALARPHLVTYKKMLPMSYIKMRSQWHQCCDMVTIGDSRVNQGLSPASMRDSLGDRRILNYAFNGAGYSDEYLEAAQQILDPDSSNKSILLGITPRSLTEMACMNNEFTNLLAFRENGQSTPGWLAKILHLFRPYDRPEIREFINPKDVNVNLKTVDLCADGWVAMDQKYPTPQKGYEFIEVLNNDHNGFVSPKVMQRLLDKVKQWTQKGITVYGFRPPMLSELARLENEYSGYHELDFIEKFKNAGGCWLEVDSSNYPAPDGVHLNREMAIKFSRDLAQKIVRY